MPVTVRRTTSGARLAALTNMQAKATAGTGLTLAGQSREIGMGERQEAAARREGEVTLKMDILRAGEGGMILGTDKMIGRGAGAGRAHRSINLSAGERGPCLAPLRMSPRESLYQGGTTGVQPPWLDRRE